MKEILSDFKEIFEKHKGLLTAMAMLFVISMALFLFSIINLGSNTTVVRTSYTDIGSSQGESGGYLPGVWTERFAYPILAIVFGVLHNLLAVKLYRKQGSGIAGFFVLTTIGLVLATFIVFGRLLGEG